MVVLIKCVGENNYSHSLKLSIHYTNIMQSTISYIQSVYMTQGLLLGCLKSM